MPRCSLTNRASAAGARHAGAPCARSVYATRRAHKRNRSLTPAPDSCRRWLGGGLGTRWPSRQARALEPVAARTTPAPSNDACAGHRHAVRRAPHRCVRGWRGARSRGSARASLGDERRLGTDHNYAVMLGGSWRVDHPPPNESRVSCGRELRGRPVRPLVLRYSPGTQAQRFLYRCARQLHALVRWQPSATALLPPVRSPT